MSRQRRTSERGAVVEPRVMKVKDASEDLAVNQPGTAALMKLRYIGSLAPEEVAQALDIAELTARHGWMWSRKRISAPTA
jgi:hypothetical protein